MPDALADVERISRLPIDAFVIENAVSLSSEDNDNRFIVFVRHRM